VDWFRNVRIVLKGAKKDYVLEETLGHAPLENAIKDALNIFQSHSGDYITVQCALLDAMELELQKRFKNEGLFEIINELKDLFQQQARVERWKP
jgi:hypothetical protein